MVLHTSLFLCFPSAEIITVCHQVQLYIQDLNHGFCYPLCGSIQNYRNRCYLYPNCSLVDLHSASLLVLPEFHTSYFDQFYQFLLTLSQFTHLSHPPNFNNFVFIFILRQIICFVFRVCCCCLSSLLFFFGFLRHSSST